MNSEDAVKTIKSTLYVFKEFTLEAENLLLLRNSEVVPLAPKTVEVLLALIESNGKLITKQEILDKVWADTFVEEANLTHHISALRKALGEDKNGLKFIETIPRRGYRFVAPIIETNSGAAEITISERMTAHTLEEVTVETSAIEKNAVVENQSVFYDSANVPALSGNASGKRRNQKAVYGFVALCLVGLVVLVGVFGNRLFLGKSEKTAVILPSAIVQKRIMPDIDAVNPAISPDGKFAAFSWYKNGQSSIWQKNTATGEMTQLTADAPLSEIQKQSLRYSPDGQWLYYLQNDYKNRRAEIYRMTTTGGNPQRVIENINGIRGDFGFSPDGKQITFVVYGNMNSALMIADLETGKSYPAARREGGLKYFGHPLGVSPGWSPDGRRIVVGGINETGGQRVYELIEVDAETGGEKLIPISENLRIYQVEWLADGSGLMATVSEATGVPSQIAHISYPDGKITVLTDDDFGYDYIRLTKDTRTMIAGKDVGSINLWMADAKDLSRRKQITTGGNANQGSNSLAFAPDDRIIFSSPQNGSTDLWSVVSDGGGIKQLTKNTGKINSTHIVTPDNRSIVFNSIRSGTNQIWRMDADGGNPVQLSNTGRQSFDEQLSPDGKWVYYTSILPDKFVQQVYKVSIDGGESLMMTDRKYYRTPSFSPDGKLMIFTGKDENNQPLPSCIIEAATGKIIVPPEKSGDGVWASDSRHIINARSVGQELWQYDIYADKHEKLADFKPATIYNFAASPDGNKFVFSLGNISSEVVLFTNYLSGTK